MNVLTEVLYFALTLSVQTCKEGVDHPRAVLLQKTLLFFNGDLRDQGRWAHHCSGPSCHACRQDALNEVPCRVGSSIIFTLEVGLPDSDCLQ